MSASISTDVAYVLKNLNEIRSDNQKRKQNFIIQYGENKILDGNIYLSKEESQLQPNVKVENVDNETYRTLIMVDPDAPNRDNPVKGPVLHWLVANFQSNNLADCHITYSYNGPSPPTGSGPHRYIFFLYQSTDRIAEEKIEREQRLRFPLQNYIIENRLELLDATYFTVSN